MNASVTQQIVDAAARMRIAADYARLWTGQSWCCQPSGLTWQPCLKPACVARQQRWSYYWAVAAAHEARQLMRVSSVVGDSVAFTCGEDRAEMVLRRTERAT